MIYSMTGYASAVREFAYGALNLELRSVNPLSDRLYLRLQEHACEDGRLPASTTIKSIAEEIGATAEATYRALAALERKGSVHRLRRGVVKVL